MCRDSGQIVGSLTGRHQRQWVSKKLAFLLFLCYRDIGGNKRYKRTHLIGQKTIIYKNREERPFPIISIQCTGQKTI